MGMGSGKPTGLGARLEDFGNGPKDCWRAPAVKPVGSGWAWKFYRQIGGGVWRAKIGGGGGGRALGAGPEEFGRGGCDRKKRLSY